jgi:hypothetical protein
VTDEDGMSAVAFDFFNEALGTVTPRINTINLTLLGMQRLNPVDLRDRFTKEEVWNPIHALPPDKAPGLDGFMTRFLQVTWPVIRPDLMAAFDASGI